MQDTEIRIERTHPSPPARTVLRDERDVVVPLVDEQEAGRIYDSSLLRWALWSGLIASLVLGWLGAALANGDLPIAGFGQWAAAGPLVGAVTGGGLGLAIGGLAGALPALYRMPARHPASPAEAS